MTAKTNLVGKQTSDVILKNQEQQQHDIRQEFSIGKKGSLYLLPSFNRVSRGNE